MALKQPFTDQARQTDAQQFHGEREKGKLRERDTGDKYQPGIADQRSSSITLSLIRSVHPRRHEPPIEAIGQRVEAISTKQRQSKEGPGNRMRLQARPISHPLTPMSSAVPIERSERVCAALPLSKPSKIASPQLAPEQEENSSDSFIYILRSERQACP